MSTSYKAFIRIPLILVTFLAGASFLTGCGIDRDVFLVNQSEKIVSVYVSGPGLVDGTLEPGARLRLPYIAEPPTHEYYVVAENQDGELVFIHTFNRVVDKNEWKEIPSSGDFPDYEISIPPDIPLRGIQVLPGALEIYNQTKMTLFISINDSVRYELAAGASTSLYKIPVLPPPASRTVRIIGMNKEGQIVLDKTISLFEFIFGKVILSENDLIQS